MIGVQVPVRDITIIQYYDNVSVHGVTTIRVLVDSKQMFIVYCVRVISDVTAPLPPHCTEHNQYSIIIIIH